MSKKEIISMLGSVAVVIVGIWAATWLANRISFVHTLLYGVSTTS